MKAYDVAIEIRSMYTVEIMAENEEQAEEIANNMQSTEIKKEGRCTNVETQFIEIKNEEEDEDNQEE